MEEDPRLWIALYQGLFQWQASMNLLVPNGKLLGDRFFFFFWDVTSCNMVHMCQRFR